jgi:hypothetical protein
VTAGEDVGAGDPELAAALESGDVIAVRTALLAARLLVPVVATVPEAAAGSGRIESDGEGAEMAVPRLVGADGRHALPVFSSYDAMRAWRADARPVPMMGEKAVSGAIAEGYDAVILDVAGPVTHIVELGPELSPEPRDALKHPRRR